MDVPTAPLSDDNRTARYALVALVIVGVSLSSIFGYLGRRTYLLNPVWIYLAGYTIAFVWYAYAAGRVVPQLSPVNQRTVLGIILGFVIVFRLCVLFSPPSLSTDMYRYVWDGRLTDSGINPYRWTPNSQTLRDLRDPVWQQMEYKPFQTIYMPVSQMVFAAGYALFGNSLIGYKSLYFLFDLGTMAILLRLLAWLRRPLTHIIWYAWCPLTITEFALAGHQDIVGVFFLLLTLDLMRRPSPIGGAVALAASILTKGFALLLVPLFVRNYGHRFTLAAGLALLYLGMPLWVYLPEFMHGMKQYLDNVHANAGLFHWLNMGLTHIARRSHFSIAQKISDGVIGAVALWAAWRPASSESDFIRRAFIVLSVTLLVVPTMFPWYLIWPLALMPLIGKRPSYSFVLLTGLSVLLYTFYVDIKAYWWTPIAEYVPFYVALVVEYMLWRRVRPVKLEKTLEMPRWMLASAMGQTTAMPPNERAVP